MAKKKVRVNKSLIKDILETPFWLESLSSDNLYFRTHDDNDGEKSQGVGVAFSPDGDAWLMPHMETLRFRTFMGGGASLRVRNALIILAEAIRLDNGE